MIITNKKSIRNVDNFLKGFEAGDIVQIVLTDIDSFRNKLILMGFTSNLAIGEIILPPIYGTVSDFNANGRYEPRKDLPKETYYTTQSTTIKAYGKYDVSIIKEQPYQKYKVELVEEAPNLELFILIDNNNNKIISTKEFIYNQDSKKLIKHSINLFLELFGECNIVDDEFLTRVRTKINRLNWNILPKGEIIWEKSKIKIVELLEKTNIQNKEDTIDRFEYISRFNPDFMAIGNGGFNDYVVFGFNNKNLYVLENSFAGNATYILNFRT